MDGAIIINTECQCGHRATLTSTMLGEDAMTFMRFERLRCSACGRKGRPEVVTRTWVAAHESAAYRGSYRGS